MDFKVIDNLLAKRRKMIESHTYSLPATGYRAFMARIDWPMRAFLALSLLTVFGWAGLIPLQFSTLAIFIALTIVFPDYIFTGGESIDAVRNMPAMLHIELRGDERYLRLGMEEAPLSVVKKVAISQRNSDQAFIDFPYTSRITSPLLFPLQQIDSVRAWFVENAPEVKLIE
ncbi:MAG: hypothetical protein JJU03_10440 [Idiomarina sp.]|nr:hypothetical protein [Idiomarina sp.]